LVAVAQVAQVAPVVLVALAAQSCTPLLAVQSKSP
jgi:hypothetical protein